MGQDKRDTGAGIMNFGVFKTGLLHIHLGGSGLTVLNDSCDLLNNRLYCIYIFHKQIYVYREYLESSQDSRIERLRLPLNYTASYKGIILENYHKTSRKNFPQLKV